MPLFFTPKPRKFHYDPRFYDPEKEKWEALKQKYADEKQQEQSAADATAQSTASSASDDDENLRYFEDKVRNMERRKKQQLLGWKDLFRKREMPTFNYQPRFQQGVSTTANNDAPAEDDDIAEKYGTAESKHHVRIKRRYDIEDPEYMKPMPAGKIMIYGLLTFLLLFWILF